jgi:hypothetical protein
MKFRDGFPGFRTRFSSYGMACPESGAYHFDLLKISPKTRRRYPDLRKTCLGSRAKHSDHGILSLRSGARNSDLRISSSRF